MAAEEGAHAARRGIWVGEFELPVQWRRERRIDRLLAAPPLTVPTLGARGLLPGFTGFGRVGLQQGRITACCLRRR